ncbi:MAG: excinuclease ABC subunit A [Candidatus Melainabacteria bacterium RIFCSPHIGHO2_02_FULL_34_12]|nr:MAG: excinuclease ABC subunit A [Candidatus Melainabacteria bacterium RIFCSPHIGHO2_02_FULL_34_12]
MTPEKLIEKTKQNIFDTNALFIRVKGAKEHNLKNVNVDIPKNKLVVITGVSGSGKSSLAFDTIFAEGQRRYVESLSSYARQFLGQLDKPDVESIEGLSPAISIDQKSTSHNPRSTVATVTEVYDYLRLLFARIGIPHCHICGEKIKPQTIDQIIDQIFALPEGTKAHILSPLVQGKKGEYQALFSALLEEGFARVRINGKTYQLEEDIKLERNLKHNIELIIDRVVIKNQSRSRIADSVSLAIKRGDGIVVIEDLHGKKDLVFSEKLACPFGHGSIAEVSPRAFSFNSPYGACSSCHGLGYHAEFDPNLVVPNLSKSLNEGAILPWAKTNNPYYKQLFESLAKHYKFNLDVPWKELSKKIQKTLLYGSEEDEIKFKVDSWEGDEVWTYKSNFEGVLNQLKRRYEETESEKHKQDLEGYMTKKTCKACQGKRLKPEILAVTVNDASISELCDYSIREAMDFFVNLPGKLTSKEKTISHQLLIEIKARLKFLIDVGLDYLSLNRAANTLSGGEAQRIRLATQIGSGLSGVLYVLDEPSIGLHQRDNMRLLNTLKYLRDLGNTLLVVEHDEETIRTADWIIDIGPKAGLHGGEIIAEGRIPDIIASSHSITGEYLSGKKEIAVPKKRRDGSGNFIEVKNAHLNNLKNINVKVPLGKLTAVTGVSGSGKSSLINDLLFEYLRHKIYGSVPLPLEIDEVVGAEQIDKVIVIDQSPIGRTPRSNPATYIGLFDVIREIFSMTNEAKARGYQKGRFSFNVKGGRCEACSGEGLNEIEMNFLPSVFVTCEVCKGKRYNRETLEVKFKGASISDVLDMTVEEALVFFDSVYKAKAKLQTLFDVGLGYIKLGQPATTLSGGEAQRVKLAEQLSRRSTGKTIYLLDEPTVGLHWYDVDHLLLILNRLVDTGNTVVVIEHNPDVIKQADWIIDLGPEGGDRGGEIVCEGTPEQVAKVNKSYTGQYLKKVLY